MDVEKAGRQNVDRLFTSRKLFKIREMPIDFFLSLNRITIKKDAVHFYSIRNKYIRYKFRGKAMGATIQQVLPPTVSGRPLLFVQVPKLAQTANPMAFLRLLVA